MIGPGNYRWQAADDTPGVPYPGNCVFRPVAIMEFRRQIKWHEPLFGVFELGK